MWGFVAGYFLAFRRIIVPSSSESCSPRRVNALGLHDSEVEVRTILLKSGNTQRRSVTSRNIWIVKVMNVCSFMHSHLSSGWYSKPIWGFRNRKSLFMAKNIYLLAGLWSRFTRLPTSTPTPQFLKLRRHKTSICVNNGKPIRHFITTIWIVKLLFWLITYI
jgi:hypothetical protein